MQSKGSVLIFLAILAFPIIAISTNHNLFFGALSAIVAAVSFKYLYYLLIKNEFADQQPDEDLEAELEELADVDMRKVGAGLSITYNLLVILYLIYCSFYLDTFLLKGIIAFAILLQMHFIIKKVNYKKTPYDKNLNKPQILLSSVSNIVVVVFAVLNKILCLINYV